MVNWTLETNGDRLVIKWKKFKNKKCIKSVHQNVCQLDNATLSMKLDNTSAIHQYIFQVTSLQESMWHW